MKSLEGHFPSTDGIGTRRGLSGFSLAQLTITGIIAGTIVMAIAAMVIYFLNGKTVDQYFQQRAETLAGNLAYEIVDSIRRSVISVEGAALDPQVIQALKEKDSGQIAAIELRLVKQFPEALRA